MRNGSGLLAACGLAAVVALAAAGALAAPYVEVPASSDNFDWDSKAQTSLFGEFRTSLSDYLILKADRTHHRGVMIRHLTDREMAHLTPLDAKSEQDHDIREHHEQTTVVPQRKEDWRGLIGEAQRNVEPMMDMQNHKHGDARQTIALYWMTVRANPRLVSAYVDGSYVMRSRENGTEEAVRFLRDGEQHNPGSLAIKTELGHVLFVYAHDTARAEESLTAALRLSRSAPRLSDEEREARTNAYRWLALLYQNTSRPAQAVTIAKEGETVIGHDVTLEQVLSHHGQDWSP
jgi:hypothetical protein